MNTHILSPRAHFGAFFALMACLLVAAPQLQAAPPAAIHSANAPATVYITVPASGAPATFMVGSKKTTVAAGSTVVLPKGAKNINLPKGTVVSASIPCEHCPKGLKLHYTVKKDIALAGFNPQSFASHKKHIKSGLPAGQIQLPDYLTSHQCVCKHRGNGQISLPSPTIANLIKAVLSASGGTVVNPFNVLGEGVTDGN